MVSWAFKGSPHNLGEVFSPKSKKQNKRHALDTCMNEGHVNLRASPVALHMHMRFFIHDADADAGLGPGHYDSCKSHMRI